jgi:predicted Zn-dependent protease with MMP-like domain
MRRSAFERLVSEAVLLIPADFRSQMQNLAIVVEDEPSAELLAAMEMGPDDTLYGLYEGTPLPERAWAHGNVLPDRITLFQGPIEEDCEDEDDVREVIGETLIHEVGHYFGLSEEEIEAIEERYWRGEYANGDDSTDAGDRADEPKEPGPGGGEPDTGRGGGHT